MQSNSLLRKEVRVELGVEEASRLMSSRSTEEGWCLVACRGVRAAARQQAAGPGRCREAGADT